MSFDPRLKTVFMQHRIIPTVIAKDQYELTSITRNLSNYFDEIHLDIMDGKFVSNKSIWFDDEEFALWPNNYYEAHLMVDKPEEWIYKSLNNLKTIIPNIEQVKDPNKLIYTLKARKQKVGFALNPETQLNVIFPYLKHLDLVLLLAVNPGSYGAKFLPEVVDKIEQLRMIYDGDIEVDGGMNPLTIEICKNKGANVFAVGSYLQRSSNLEETVKELKSAIQ